MLEKIKEALKELFIKISFSCCCKSNCNIQVGKENQTDNKENQTDNKENNEN